MLNLVGRKNVWAVTSAEKGKTHTVLACASASGFSLPPFIIYPRKRITEGLRSGAFPGTVFNCSDSGWVNGELFLVWLNFFPSRPVLLILDGHASHVSIQVIEFARSNMVPMLCLPARTTHQLQPMDISVSFYYKACKRYMTDHPGRVMIMGTSSSYYTPSDVQAYSVQQACSLHRRGGIFRIRLLLLL